MKLQCNNIEHVLSKYGVDAETAQLICGIVESEYEALTGADFFVADVETQTTTLAKVFVRLFTGATEGEITYQKAFDLIYSGQTMPDICARMSVFAAVMGACDLAIYIFKKLRQEKDIDGQYDIMFLEMIKDLNLLCETGRFISN